MADYEYDDFWVEFSPRAGKGYDVDARAPDGETARGEFELPFTDEQLEQAVRTLGSTRAAATTRDIGEVTAERRLTAEQLGGTLADALLSGPTGALYTAARSAAVAHGRGVRLWLSLGKAPGLLSVPWEFLYLQPTFLASQRKTPIVRFLRTDAPVAPRRIEKEVRILGVIASPDGLPKLKVDLERQRVDKALEKARQNREVTVDWLEPATPKALRLKLQEGDYHILHFIGHSGYTGGQRGRGDGGGVIFLENEDHSKAQISDSQLVNLLGDQDSLRLVVLNSCEGARTSVRDPFAGIATSIVALGIPAVVAMQFEITDDAAITFAEELYGSLIAREDPIDVAVAEARKAVFTEVNETEWATPVLFLRNEDGRLFDFVPVVPLPEPKKAEPEIAPTPPPPKPQPWVKPTPTDRPAWLAVAVVAVAVVALLGGASALGLFADATASPTPGDSMAVVDESPSGPTETETPTSGATEPDQTVAPATRSDPDGHRRGMGRPAPQVEPARSRRRAVGHGRPSQHGRSQGGREHAVGGCRDLQGEGLRHGPGLDPDRLRPRVHEVRRRRIGDRVRRARSRADAGRPGRQGDHGQGSPDRRTHRRDRSNTRLPGWRDGNMLFARTNQCAPQRGCAEDIMTSELTWSGDWIVHAGDPIVVSRNWADVRHMALDPNGGRFLVTARNLDIGGEELGIWVVANGAPQMVAGSVNVTFAVWLPDGRIVGVIGDGDDGWGSTVAVWARRWVAPGELRCRGGDARLQRPGCAGSGQGTVRLALVPAQRSDASRSSSRRASPGVGRSRSSACSTRTSRWKRSSGRSRHRVRPGSRSSPSAGEGRRSAARSSRSVAVERDGLRGQRRVAEDEVGRLLGQHHDRRVDVAVGDVRHRRGVDHPQTVAGRGRAS